MAVNLDQDSTFVYGQFGPGAGEVGLPITIPFGTIFVGSINGLSGSITLSGGATGLSFSAAGATISLSGTLDVDNGGTGRATLGANGVLIGAGTSGVNVTGAGTAGQVLTSNGAGVDPTFQPVSGSAPALNVVLISILDDPYSLTDANDVVNVHAGGGDVTILLHDPSTAVQKLYQFKLVANAGNDMILDGDGFNIDGAATQSTNVLYVAFSLIPDNALGEWLIY